jgi:hypothetical protein
MYSILPCWFCFLCLIVMIRHGADSFGLGPSFCRPIDEIDTPNLILIAADALQHRREFRPSQRRRGLPLFRLPRIELGDSRNVAVNDRKWDHFIEQAIQGLFLPIHIPG